MSTIVKALNSLVPNTKWAVTNNCYEGIEWLDTEVSIPSKEQILAEMQKISAYEDSIIYKVDRQKDYPTIEDQLDMQYWDLINGTTTWLDTIKAIKARYPKPEGI